MTTSRDEAGPAAAFGFLVAATLLVGLLGYAGYELYPRFDLPAVDGIPLLLLAAAAGVASFFSPCAFPLLVTLLARPIDAGGAAGEKGPDRHSPGHCRVGRALGSAVPLAAGATIFLALCGLAIALGAGVLFAGVTFTSTAGRLLRGGVGLSLLLLGAVQLGLLPDWFRPVDEWARPLLAAQARQRRRSPWLGYGIFGFGYLLAGFG